MKQSIAWHKESIKNWKLYVENEESHLLNRLENIKKDKDKIAFYQKQIDEAVAKHKEGFDYERFLKQKTEDHK